MIICGLKLTHDGSIAVIEHDKLLFSIEMEKLNNNPRYTAIEDTAIIEEILKDEGLSLSDIDKFAIDGWGGYDTDALAIQPRLTIGDNSNMLSALDNGEKFYLDVAQYREKTAGANVLERCEFEGLRINGKQFPYSSYLHVTGHITSAYCTSPFAQRNEDSYILVWDGGMFPRLYYFDARLKQVENLGPLFLFIGNIYTIFSQHFGPFKVSTGFAKDDLSIAGKVMAYIALGELKRELFPIFDEIYKTHYDKPMGFANVFAREFKKRISGLNYKDEDILLSFHIYLSELLVKKLEKKLSRPANVGRTRNLCYAGGCALNIKWNRDIRSSGLFEEVYVPPFPNDSGSAIGAACSEMINSLSLSALNWNVYSGPGLKAGKAIMGWEERNCSIEELAHLLYESQEPVIFLNRRAELGPRALGNRSILADPRSIKMKDILNTIKKREDYRPVSPICLEEKAKQFFDPGTKDPFMLFDQRVRMDCLQKIPAICHLDHTARLQTVNAEQNSEIAALLTEFEKLSGVPMLCNTSANYKGKGFFPDVESVIVWGGVNHVWSDFKLYSKVKSEQHMPLTR